MAGTRPANTSRSERRKAADERLIDRELEDLPAELRWREWMLRVEAVIFASAEPVARETLVRVVGRSCSIDLLIEDLREEIRTRPYDIVAVAGGWQHRTRAAYGPVIRASAAPTRSGAASLSEYEAAVLMAIAYLQPVTRGELLKVFGKDVSRDTIGSLRDAGFIGSGPRSPTPGAPYTYVTTKQFLSVFGLETLRDLPDLERLEDAGLLSRQALVQDTIAEPESQALEGE
ncbi:SMC-Scp complex subunit ScpB [Sinorhizobium fredii]|uniref:Chromosome segregation/condensation ScpB-like protein n=1 Tax=Rhizobium fredii TaxID=380 RepID=A0A2L0HB31_RHIFR|nr:SMC-Scp complex subunit ScpB [Sinorhizobium fredii]AUX78675.1 chromosome segregation/condensation ScpB-like protein [Sinorhizobium fredii]